MHLKTRSIEAPKPTQYIKKPIESNNYQAFCHKVRSALLNFKYFIVHRLNMHVNKPNLDSFIESSWPARTKASMIILWSNKLTQTLQLQSPAPLLPRHCKRISKSRENTIYCSLPPLISCYSINLIHKCIERTLVTATLNVGRFPSQYYNQWT